MLFLTMTGRREEDTIQEETPDSIEEESPETEKREERQRLEKLLSKYKETFMDSTSYSSSSMNSCKTRDTWTLDVLSCFSLFVL